MLRDSESYEAGLRPGDVIVEFNRQVVDDPSQFFRLVADAKIGSTAPVKVLREGRAMDFRLPIVVELGVVRQRAPLTGRPTTLHWFQ